MGPEVDRGEAEGVRWLAELTRKSKAGVTAQLAGKEGRGNGVPAARGLAGLRGQRRPRLRGTSGTLGLYPEGDRKV